MRTIHIGYTIIINPYCEYDERCESSSRSTEKSSRRREKVVDQRAMAETAMRALNVRSEVLGSRDPAHFRVLVVLSAPGPVSSITSTMNTSTVLTAQHTVAIYAALNPCNNASSESHRSSLYHSMNTITTMFSKL